MTNKNLKPLLDEEGIFAAVAIDQRNALKKLLKDIATPENMSKFKQIVSKVLTPYGSSILLDPEYGLEAAEKRDSNAGLILSYEQTGYDKSQPGRLPRLIEGESVAHLKEAGADAVKLLVYFDPDEGDEINDKKKDFIEQVGKECDDENIPFLLELVTYDKNINDEKGAEYARVRPHKVNKSMKIFSDPRYKVDVLKMETPVNMNFVEGYGKEAAVYTKEEAAQYFKEQDAATSLPYIYLSGGISSDLFNKALQFAHESGSHFNGVLCGRATWKGGTEALVNEGWEAAERWISEEGLSNLNALNEVNKTYATPIK